jgi:hypothetical protein
MIFHPVKRRGKTAGSEKRSPHIIEGKGGTLGPSTKNFPAGRK